MTDAEEIEAKQRARIRAQDLDGGEREAQAYRAIWEGLRQAFSIHRVGDPQGPARHAVFDACQDIKAPPAEREPGALTNGSRSQGVYRGSIRKTCLLIKLTGRSGDWTKRSASSRRSST
jgi:hypothetical protein